MNKILIAEDEKLIRQGIKAMIERAPITYSEIIECKNGKEALNIINSTKIDVLFTDIKMPKMDGITLVKNISELKTKPEVIIISGYDDFSYAVSALRYGAREYILKPIHRDEINKILVKLEDIINQKEKEELKEQNIKNIIEQQIKYILINPQITKEELESIAITLETNFFLNKQYKIYCFSIHIEFNENESLYFEDINNQNILIIPRNKQMPEILYNKAVGISTIKEGLYNLRNAYNEAVIARKYAYIENKNYIEYNIDLNKDIKTLLSELDIDKFIQMLGTNKIEEAKKVFINIFNSKNLESIHYESFELLMDRMQKKITNTYSLVIEQDILDNINNYYKNLNLKYYIEKFIKYIETINIQILKEHEDFRNKQKMKVAIEYINEKYNKDLTMAVVANYVSLNYSFFSQVFKDYTGMNFVNYLKTIRINNAKQLLSETDFNIAEISNKVGYENEKHFMKVFKNVVGVSPTEYRKNSAINVDKK